MFKSNQQIEEEFNNRFVGIDVTGSEAWTLLGCAVHEVRSFISFLRKNDIESLGEWVEKNRSGDFIKVSDLLSHLSKLSKEIKNI